MEVVGHRSKHYKFLIAAVLRALGVPASRLDFVQESEYSTSRGFWRDLLRMLAVSSQDQIKAVGLEVTTTRMMSPLVCPTLQALSEVYLGCDFQLGGLDQVCTGGSSPYHLGADPASAAYFPTPDEASRSLGTSPFRIWRRP